MLYVLDTADLSDIRYANECYPLDGVTTNPSLIAKEQAEFLPLVKEIRAILGDEKMLCIQTLAKTCAEIVRDGEALQEAVGGRLYLKIPISEAALQATPLLKAKGIGVLMTAIFTPAQALLSARAGADLVAPYVNRLDSIVGDGVAVVGEIVRQLALFSPDCKVLAASFKNAEQVHKCASVGCHSVTLPLELLQALISHPMTDAAVQGFDRDWSKVYGNRSISDLIQQTENLPKI